MSPNVKTHYPLRVMFPRFSNERKQWEQMTREEIEQKMDELARKYTETHDKEIVEALYKLALELEKMEKVEKQ